ncbi:hypothetical protein [[Ruminococcus] lactaris]|uniref:hypothetical protein n=1 Tax=[Ruminococcus] lactaris TaxID=46228 RepID=UPI0035209836
MNDSELRRRELLKQTRRLYQDSAAIPAVHPRYGHIYHELYDTPDSGEAEHHSGSFFARLMLSVFLFLSFVYIEQNHLKPADISSTQIVNEIQKEIPGNGMDFISRIKLY